ncbi:substrate-binding domain-containing protein, partial [Psychromonas sp.]|nr:substrate-binding domain-containing protein [Psychromonas sp.]
ISCTFVRADLQTDPPKNQRLEAYSLKTPSYRKTSESFSELIQHPASPISFEQKEPVIVYFINPTLQISDYWRRNQIAFERRLDELGIKYIIRIHDIKTNSPEEQKQRLLHRALSDEPNFIILTLDAAPDVAFIDAMLKPTKTQLIVLNVTEPILSWGTYQPLIYVGFDHVLGTKMLANYFIETFPKNSKFAVNNFYPSYISQFRGDKFIDIVSKKNMFNLLSHEHTQATHGSARTVTRTLIDEHPDVDFIYSCSTDIALGTSNELKSLGRSDIKLNGWGGGTEELEAIKRKELAVTVMRMNDDNGVAMAEAVKLSLEKKQQSIPLVYSGEFQLVTTETSSSDIAEFKKQAFRYSGLDL